MIEVLTDADLAAIEARAKETLAHRSGSANTDHTVYLRGTTRYGDKVARVVIDDVPALLATVRAERAHRRLLEGVILDRIVTPEEP